MKFVRKRLLPLLILCTLLPAYALALTGQSISTFETYYQEDITYLNDITGRHLLAKDLLTLNLNDNGRTQYYYYDDTLQVTLAADASGIIESCEIRLLWPENAEEGNSLYLGYVTSSYHSIAFIMAMHVSSDVDSRYLLAEEIRSKLADNYGAYERQLGSYSISCVSVVGEGAVFTFTNNGLSTVVDTTDETTTTDEQTVPDVVDDDEEANYG